MVTYVTEFVSQGSDLNGRQLPVAALPILATQTIASSTTSASSTNAFQSPTQLIRITTDTTVSVAIGPYTGTGVLTATTTNLRMAANQTEYFSVPGNSGYKVAVIANS
jgi:hypothetical protein